MDSNEFITTEEVVSEGVEYLNDTNFTKGVGRSFYEMIVHRAIEDLALHTFFQKVTKDIYNWNCNCGSSTCCGCSSGGQGNNGIIAMPKNMFNLKEVYLFNSTCDGQRNVNGNDSCCNCSSACWTGGNIVETGECCCNSDCWTYYEEAHWKRTFNKFGSSGIKTSTINTFSTDPINGSFNNYWNQGKYIWGHNRLIYFGVQNGFLCFSDTALRFNNMRIIANGFGTDNCELPIVPRYLRQACVDMLKLKGAMRLMLVYPEYKQLYPVYKNDLYGDNTVQNPGSWLRAERHVKSLNTKQRNDMSIYYGNINIK